MSAYALSHRAPAQAKEKKIPIEYRVQPGDSLSKIASKFKTTVEDLKQVNGLKTDLIHPEQWLWIYAVGRSQRGQPKTAHGAKATVSAQAQKAREAHAKAKAHPSDKDAQAQAAKSKHPAYLDQLSSWLTYTPISYARSKDGQGAPLALFDPGDRRAPWMEVAVEEAKKWAGKDESEITDTSNYHEFINDGLKSLVGTSNAWCAAFVNYCLQVVGYKKWHTPMRARAIKEDGNFVKIDKPVYGAIALIGTHHVTFVYGQEKSSKYAICLGGNQKDQINFCSFHEATTFYVPIAYLQFAKKEIESSKSMAEFTPKELNDKFGTHIKEKIKESTK